MFLDDKEIFSCNSNIFASIDSKLNMELNTSTILTSCRQSKFRCSLSVTKLSMKDQTEKQIHIVYNWLFSLLSLPFFLYLLESWFIKSLQCYLSVMSSNLNVSNKTNIHWLVSLWLPLYLHPDQLGPVPEKPTWWMTKD